MAEASSSPAPEISVIIPAYNAQSIIAECVRALVAQTLPREQYEIIVVDDGSTDATASAARDAGCDAVIEQPNAGPGVARNRGAEEAHGDIIVFTDADCTPEHDFLERLTSVFTDSSVVGAKGSYRTEQRSLVARFVQHEYEDRYRFMSSDTSIDFIDTYAAAFRRDVFLRYGGYSSAFPTACVEDQEFSFRLAADGLEMRFVPDAVVLHRHADTWWGYARKKYKIAYWKVLVLKLHPQKGVKDSHTPQRVKLHLPLVLVAGASGGMGLLLSIFGITSFAAWLVALAALGASVALEIPFMLRVWPMDSAVAIAAPGMVWTRTVAVIIGLATGMRAFGKADNPREETDGSS